MIGFVCGNPYGVIAAMHLAQTRHQGENTILYLLMTNAFTPALAEAIAREGAFGEVRRIPVRPPAKRPNRLLGALRRVLLDADRTRLVTRDFACDRLYFAWPDLPFLANIIRRVGKKRRDACAFLMMEEGIGFYAQDPLNMLHGWIKRLLALTGRGRALARADTLCVFEPGLVQGARRLKIAALPKVDFTNPALRAHVAHIWPADNATLARARVIFLSQMLFPPTFQGAAREVFVRFDQQVAALLDGALPRDQYAVKLHPRQKDQGAFPREACVAEAFPLEAFLLQNDVSDKLLIAVNSTALITPFLMFGQSPRVMMLQRAFMRALETEEAAGRLKLEVGSWYSPERREEENTRYIGLFTQLRGLYGDPARVTMPADEHAVRCALRAFLSD